MLRPCWNDRMSWSVITFLTVSSTSQQWVYGQKSRRERRLKSTWSATRQHFRKEKRWIGAKGSSTGENM